MSPLTTFVLTGAAIGGFLALLAWSLGRLAEMPTPRPGDKVVRFEPQLSTWDRCVDTFIAGCGVLYGAAVGLAVTAVVLVVIWRHL